MDLYNTVAASLKYKLFEILNEQGQAPDDVKFKASYEQLLATASQVIAKTECAQGKDARPLTTIREEFDDYLVNKYAIKLTSSDEK